MKLRVFYSNDEDDYLAPTIQKVGVYPFNNRFFFRVTAEDDSGIAAVIVNYIQDGPNGKQWTHIMLTEDLIDDLWKGSILQSEVSGNAFYVQVVDQAGNVQMGGNKGIFFKPGSVGEFLPTIYLPLVVK